MPRAAGLALALVVVVPSTADAYIGPGAGFALLSSFLVMATTVLVAIAAILAWPVRAAWRALTGTARPKAHITRLVVLGLDGQDPLLTDRYMAEGKLPNFARLAAMGSYSRLRTTFPSVSPVAWSSFSTGTNPARHNIFDFLDRDRRTYLPVLSSARVGRVRRTWKLGRWRIPLARPELRLLRKSRPFWALLGERRIWSTILRVPITFPPDRFHGAQLSAMSVPDLLGTQGTFTFYTTRAGGGTIAEGGTRIVVHPSGNRVETVIEGPPNPFLEGQPPMRLPLSIELTSNGEAEARVGRTRVLLRVGELSEWIAVSFRAAPGIAVSGICRMLLTEASPELSLYVTPVNIDPERPAMPISHPPYYASYLAARIGKFATLGLAEDTWALNEGVIDDSAFLEQAYGIDGEREAMFFAALDRLRTGTLVTVFDATDRIQHMFWREMDSAPRQAPAAAATAIEDLYVRNDTLVGKALDRMDAGDVLMVISDHGFAAFRRGVNLNAWLREHGYLVLIDGADGEAEWLRDIDWSRTRAYALGLTSLFLNLAGREASGIVSATEAPKLKAELIARLSSLVDEETGEVAITEVFDSAAIYEGPYIENAPDMIVGYNRGFRVSWACATGVAAGPVFSDNTRKWSGDHSVDPRLVPGVFFCNRRIDVDNPSLVDIAPTALTLFGLQPPGYMEGRPLFRVPSGEAA